MLSSVQSRMFSSPNRLAKLAAECSFVVCSANPATATGLGSIPSKSSQCRRGGCSHGRHEPEGSTSVPLYCLCPPRAMPSRTGPLREEAGECHLLVKDPAQVQGLCLLGSAGILNLADMGQERVQDVLTSPGELSPVPLLGQDSIVEVAGLRSVEFVPWFPSGIIGEHRGIPQEVQNFVGSVRLPVGPGVGIGRVLTENVRGRPLDRIFELLGGDAGAYPVPVRGGLRPAPQGPRG